MKKQIILKSVVLMALLILSSKIAISQTDSLGNEILDPNYTTPNESHFMVVGLTTFGFASERTNQNGTVSKNNTVDGDTYEFSPMFLWRHGKNMLLEFEPSFTGGSTLGVNWADISYFAAPGLIIRCGYLVLPFGMYSKRLAAGWIDKVAPDPNGVNPAGTDFGVEIEGGFPLGSMKWSYDISLTNGQQLQPDGSLLGIGITDNNNNKTVCGRLALLPFSNSSLEIGVSALQGNVGDANTSLEKITTQMYAADLSYVKKIRSVLVNVKAQYNIVNVDKNNYTNPTDTTQTYTFNNTTNSFFGQASFRPVGVSNKIVKNFELAYRYVNYMAPKGSLWQQSYNESDIGLDYWLTWRTVLKLTYAIINTTTDNNPAIGVSNSTAMTNRIYLQFSTQF